jgi:MerR family copper efflux transcriptional regulator
MLIGEIAKTTGLSKDGIRHYEAMGLISSTPRKAGSKTYRDYDPSVLETIEHIRGAQQILGLSLKEIGPLLKAVADHPPTKEETIEFLEERLVVIREKITSLREAEDYICRKIERYRKEMEPASCSTQAARKGRAKEKSKTKAWVTRRR